MIADQADERVGVLVMSDHTHHIQPGLRSCYDRVELRDRLVAVDLVAVDIDECLFPGFSQSWLGHLILYQLVTRPRRLEDLRFIPQLLSGGGYIRRIDLLRRLGRRPPSDQAMIERYVQSMRGIPEEYFLRGLPRIPSRSFRGVFETLAALGARATLGLISFGIHLIAEEFMRQINAEAEAPVVAFAEANRIVFAPRGSDGRRIFDGYRAPVWTRPEDKLAVLKGRLAQHRAKRPLVIGNSHNEREMATHARKLGGLSVGYQPASEDAQHFDLVVGASDWRPLLYLIQGTLA